MIQWDKVLSKLVEKPRRFSVLYPAKILYEYGIDNGLNILRPLITGDYIYVKNMLETGKPQDIIQLITLLDRYIYSPSSRGEFLESFRNELSIGEISTTQYGRLSKRSIFRIIDNLRRLYSFLEKQFYISINNVETLSLILNIPRRELYLTNKLIKRSKWIAEQLYRRNSIIILGPDFSGKTTHLYFTSLVFINKYGIPLAYSFEPQRYTGSIPLLLDDTDLNILAYLRNKWFISTSSMLNLDILSRLYDNIVVLDIRDLQYNRSFNDKVIVLRTDAQIYDSDEMKELALNLATPYTDNLLELHMMHYLGKINVREEYYSPNDFIRRLILKLYFKGLEQDLLALFIAARYITTIIPFALLKVLFDILSPGLGVKPVLLPSTNRIIHIPHNRWIDYTLKVINEDKMIHDIFQKYLNIIDKLKEFRTGIIHGIKNKYEAYALALKFRDMIDYVCSKPYRKLLCISPIHYVEESVSPRMKILVNKITNSIITDTNLYDLVQEYIEAEHFINNTNLDIDKKITHINDIVLSMKPISSKCRELFEDLRNEKNKLIINYIVLCIVKRCYNHEVLEYILKNYRQLNDRLLYKIMLKLMDPRLYVEKYYNRRITTCYIIGDYNCVSKYSSPLAKYYQSIYMYKLGLYEKAIPMIYRALIVIEDAIRRGKYAYIPLLYKLMESLIWSNLNMRNEEKAKELLEEYKRLLETYSPLLDEYHYEKIRKIIRILDALLNKKIPREYNDIYDYFITLLNHKYWGEPSIDKEFVMNIVSMINHEKMINPCIFKVYIDSLIIGLEEHPINIISVIDKALSNQNPYVNIQLLRLLNHYILQVIRKNKDITGIEEKIYRSIQEAHKRSRVFREWNTLYRSAIHRRLAIYYLRKNKLDKALDNIVESIKIINRAQLIPREIHDRINDINNLWFSVISLKKNINIDTASKTLKKLIPRLNGIYKLMARYWYAYSLYKMGLYRSSIEQLYELILSEKDIRRRIIYLLLAHKVSLRMNAILSKRYLEMLMTAILRLNDIDSKIFRKIYDHIKYLSKKNRDQAVEITKLIISKFVSNNVFREKIINNDKIFTLFTKLLEHNLSVLDKRVIYNLQNILVKEDRPEIYSIMLKMLITSGELGKAYDYLENVKKKLSSITYKAYKALIHYRQGDAKKAFKEALKIAESTNDSFLDSWIYYLRGKAYLYKKKHDKAIKEFNKLLGVKPSRILLELIAEAYLRIGDYELSHGNYTSALSRYSESLKYYEDLVFFEKKLNFLEQIEYIFNKLVFIANKLGPYGGDEIIKDICKRLEKYSHRLHPMVYQRYFLSLNIHCR